jgi:hypothetical protein
VRTARPLAATAVTAGAAGAALLFAATPAGAADNATVSILHGVPGVTVDVYANGEELLPDFAPGTLTEPLSLPAGANATVVAHLTADGTPVLTPFVNDVSTVPAGQARVTVRHAAAAPAVDVRADGAVVAPGLTNPNEASLVVPAGTVSADVTLSGTDTVAIGPADLPLPEGADTIVYAWGDGEAGYQLAVQTIGGMHSSPSGVPGGSAGLADDGGVPVPVIVLSTLGLGAAAVGARRLATSRV